MNAAALNAHLATGATQTCNCWSVQRSDGVMFGFTDHDQALAFDGMTFTPESGLSAKAVSHATGLSVNNTEAVGVLTSDAITNDDLEAGRFDGAAVQLWLVQWSNVAARELQFAGTIGEIVRESGTFRADLRGLSEALNHDIGRSYLRSCDTTLGSQNCKVDLENADFSTEAVVISSEQNQHFMLELPQAYAARWFEGGFVEVIDGAAQGIRAEIKHDAGDAQDRQFTLWQPLKATVAVGDRMRLVAGCDKRIETCRIKFDNLINFQGFPDIPGDEWLAAVAKTSGDNAGGSLTK